MDLNEIITGLNKKANEVLYSKCVSLGDGQPNGIEIDHGILDEAIKLKG